MPTVRILVVEAGPFDKGEDGVRIPGALDTEPYWWPGLLSEPQRELDDRSFYLNVGRVVGGGSTVNRMAYTRASAEEYDDWVRLGNRGWGWDDILPYFKKVSSLSACRELDQPGPC
jgi:choline dehydrogenase